MAEYIEKWSVVNRLIDIENEFQQYKPFHSFEHAMYLKICEAEIEIGKTQAADVAPVRYGRWKEMHYEGGILDGTNFDKCSVCGYERVFDAPALKMVFKYCPNCGAKME